MSTFKKTILKSIDKLGKLRSNTCLVTLIYFQKCLGLQEKVKNPIIFITEIL
jgi:hypothetical protein